MHILENLHELFSMIRNNKNSDGAEHRGYVRQLFVSYEEITWFID